MAVSLSADTKDALAREIPEAAHCREALLTGLTLYGRKAGHFVTQRNAVARLFRSLLLRGGAADAPHIEKGGTARLTGAPQYRIAVPAGRPDSSADKPRLRCDRVMEVRAAFLACGSLSAGAQGYHVEFVPAEEPLAERLGWMLRAVADPPKRTLRKGRTVLYYKDFEAIVDLLTVVGGFGAVLHLQDVHAFKETKNRIHRLVNTEAANLERSAAAAASQRETIDFIASAYGLRHLSPALREICELRLRHPDESLAELGRRCNPPIAKPTVNSRLIALARLARRLRGETLPPTRKD